MGKKLSLNCQHLENVEGHFSFPQILKEDPSYPEALIGRGTAYAFQRELDAAISDFTKVCE